jgi:hypothetical protein
MQCRSFFKVWPVWGLNPTQRAGGELQKGSPGHQWLPVSLSMSVTAQRGVKRMSNIVPYRAPLSFAVGDRDVLVQNNVTVRGQCAPSRVGDQLTLTKRKHRGRGREPEPERERERYWRLGRQTAFSGSLTLRREPQCGGRCADLPQVYSSKLNSTPTIAGRDRLLRHLGTFEMPQRSVDLGISKLALRSGPHSRWACCPLYHFKLEVVE